MDKLQEIPDAGATDTDLDPTDDLNTYEGIATCYDHLMTNGYYDYGEIAYALHQVLSPHRRVLELGVGTGLVAEQLLQHCPEYSLTGIDNTEAMLRQAQDRLGDRIEYATQDITELDLGRSYEAAFSVGGCWYFIDTGTELEFCSHIDDREAAVRGLRRVVEHLEPGGVLAFALQGVHTNYSKELPDDLIYTQEIFSEDHGFFTKRYLFERHGEKVAEQLYRYLTLPAEEAHAVLADLGCRPLGLDADRKFFAYEKNA